MKIVGIAAGAVVGALLLGWLAMWFRDRCQDEAAFSRSLYPIATWGKADGYVEPVTIADLASDELTEITSQPLSEDLSEEEATRPRLARYGVDVVSKKSPPRPARMFTLDTAQALVKRARDLTRVEGPKLDSTKPRPIKHKDRQDAKRHISAVTLEKMRRAVTTLGTYKNMVSETSDADQENPPAIDIRIENPLPAQEEKAPEIIRDLRSRMAEAAVEPTQVRVQRHKRFDHAIRYWRNAEEQKKNQRSKKRKKNRRHKTSKRPRTGKKQRGRGNSTAV